MEVSKTKTKTKTKKNMKENRNKLIQYILNKKDQFYNVTWCRDCKTKKNSPKIKKMTIANIRAGIDYESLSEVKLAREYGDLPKENTGLPWGEWETFPFIIRHNDKQYLRAYPTEPTEAGGTVVKFFKEDSEDSDNFLEVPKEDIEMYLMASETRIRDDSSSAELLIITVNIDDIIEIS